MNFIFPKSPQRYFLYLIILLSTSCTNYHKLLYFQGEETKVQSPETLTTYQLRPGDILSVVFFTPDPKSAEMFNMNGTSSLGEDAYKAGYSVDDSGYVSIPVAGRIQVKGLKVKQVDSIVSVRVKEFFNFYSVEVKLASFTFVALGEFNHKGLQYVQNDKCTIFEAIGIAGDMTDFANKKRIKVVRKTYEGMEQVYNVDLTDYSIYSNPAYNIQPHDIIYVQPQKAKITSKNLQLVSITLGILTITITLLSRF